MLFLGAGASKALGVGDLSDLTREVNTKLKVEGYGNILSEINRALEESQIYDERDIDIELSFAVLNSLNHPKEAWSDLGPFAAYLMNLNNSGFHPESLPRLNKRDIDKMRKIAQDVILNLCMKVDIPMVKKTFDELFHSATAGRLADGRSVGIMDKIVTTNYDLAIELYDPQRAEDRGFSKERTEHWPVLNIRSLKADNIVINFLKLHGSVDWVQRSDGRIFWRESLESLYAEDFRQRLMIYPIYEKYVSAEPYYSLFTRFKHMLREEFVCIAIGYSFRDPSINNALADALAVRQGDQGQTSRIIIVNSDMTEIERIRTRFNSLNVPKNRISYLQESFGDPHAIQEIKTALENPTYLAE